MTHETTKTVLLLNIRLSPANLLFGYRTEMDYVENTDTPVMIYPYLTVV